MGKNYIDIDTAEIIINRYAELQANRASLENHEKYQYSDMNGYDIIDIYNSFCLLLAEEVYICKEISNKIYLSLKRMSDEYGGIVLNYFTLFIPDKEKYRISMLPHDKRKEEYFRLTSNFHETNEWKEIMSREKMSSFIDYCIDIKESHDFWTLVYIRLNLTMPVDKPASNEIFEKSDRTIESEKSVSKSFKTSIISLSIYAVVSILLLLWSLNNELVKIIAFTLIGFHSVKSMFNIAKSRNMKNNRINFFSYFIYLSLVILGFIINNSTNYVILIMMAILVLFYILEIKEIKKRVL